MRDDSLISLHGAVHHATVPAYAIVGAKGKKKKNPEERIQLRWEGVVERGLREGSLDQMMHYNSLTHLSSRDCSLDRLGGPGF